MDGATCACWLRVGVNAAAEANALARERVTRPDGSGLGVVVEVAEDAIAVD